MGFLGDLAKGVGFIGSIVPGGQGFAALASLVPQDDPEAIVANPLADDLWAPQAIMWGIPRQKILLGADVVFDPESAKLQVDSTTSPLLAQALQGALANARAFVTVRDYFQILAQLKAQRDAHEGKLPVFYYIDLRDWKPYGTALWQKTYGVKSGATVVPKIPSLVPTATVSMVPTLADWLARKTKAAADAYAQWSKLNVAELGRYAQEKQTWYAWRDAQRQEEERQAAEAEIVRQFNEAWRAHDMGELTRDEALEQAPHYSILPGYGGSQSGHTVLIGAPRVGLARAISDFLDSLLGVRRT